MNYELAKELKDAGFPQEDAHFYYSSHTIPPTKWDIHVIDIHGDITIDAEVACPTLEELIEACGDRLEVLGYEDDGWYANHIVPPDRTSEPFYHGASPTEAVARLWLALNPKTLPANR